MKNITFSAEENAIAAARAAAEANGTTLNEEFRSWLKRYTSQPGVSAHNPQEAVEGFRKMLSEIRERVEMHGPFTRDQMHER